MGCIDVDTMKAVKTALYAVDPDIVVYGEGWAGLGDAGFYDTVNSKALYKNLRRASLSGTYKHLGNINGKGSVGCFSNGFRNAMKGDTANDIYPEWGFLSGRLSPKLFNASRMGGDPCRSALRLYNAREEQKVAISGDHFKRREILPSMNAVTSFESASASSAEPAETPT
jgi:hypothetical protein